ncbi:hypothetical protein [Carboxylicivirga sp. M1479]|uniref:hypothetical protein n=1 Tax=Carboxylicivirga sp. M1479 TaxID=2594476 RepID=UPI001178263F|nr:hypothetical protein [Carboxylicivirga sp. M1479]TRX70547.1 hypothetical protein FNN09_11250 [Carboxylicivirga sp. M1479]
MNNDFFKIYKALDAFETKENLNLLNTKYGNIWPLLKIEVYKSYFKDYKKLKYRPMIWRIVGNFKRAVTSFYKSNKQLPPNNIFKETDELWVSSIGRRVNGYNKFTDPFFNEMSSSKSLMIERSGDNPLFYSNVHVKSNSRILNYESSYNFFNLLFIIKNTLSFSKVLKEVKIERVSNNYPSIQIFNLLVCYSYFVNWYNFYIYFFSKFTTLKRIYYTGNGTPDTYALNAAAHKLNIETIEFQHGVISKNGIDYKYRVLNDNILKLVPSKIYVYSAEAREILKNNTKGKVTIELIENFALTNWKNNESKLGTKTSILLTLQNVIFPQDHFIYLFFKYINEKFPEMEIILRLHPSHQYVKVGFEEILEKLKIKFVWDNNAMIYDSLSNAILNITAFSSTVEDAINLKVPSWLISNEGSMLYEQHIKTNPLVKSILTIEDASLTFNSIYNNY